MKRVYFQEHKPTNFTFEQNRDDFKVDEISTFDKSVKGNFLILHVEKVNLSTMQLLKILQDESKYYNIGYAGLKDKNATTTQYISIPLKFSKNLEKFRHPQIKILERFYSKSNIKMGDLESNRFRIRLKNVTKKASIALDETLEQIQRYGMPNYFGYQRFGRESDNFERARDVAYGDIILKDKKMQRLLGNAYQSYLFNDWLHTRVELSKNITSMSIENIMSEYDFDEKDANAIKSQTQPFKTVLGDILIDYKTQKFQNVTSLDGIKKIIKERKAVPTGLLCGKKAFKATAKANEFEKDFDDLNVIANGSRRNAIVYVSKIESKYIEKDSLYELSFELPKGAYATVLLENLANKELG